MTLETAAAILPSRDFDEIAAFYAAIGFTETGRWEDEGYTILVRDKVEIHFFRHRMFDPTTCDRGVYIRRSDVDAVGQGFQTTGLPQEQEGIPRFHPAEDKPWDMRETAPIDCNGNLLRIGQFM